MEQRPEIFDLRPLQESAADLGCEGTDRFLQAVPPSWFLSASRFVLRADPEWAMLPAASYLISELKGCSKSFCLTTELADAVIHAALQADPSRMVWTPCLSTGSWQSSRGSRRLQDSGDLSSNSAGVIGRRRQRLAYFSPLPPARTGISHYSVALLPELAQYFDIDVIADPAETPLPLGAQSVVHPLSFPQKASSYNCFLYQLGNSAHHLGALSGIAAFPGVAVLHDFYLSHALCDEQADAVLDSSLPERLYRSHSYQGLRQWCVNQLDAKDDFVWKYPVNLEVLQRSLGIVVHGREPMRLAGLFYERDVQSTWSLIPHLKSVKTVSLDDRLEARAHLDLKESDFVVASFGFLGVAKRSQDVLQAFLESSLAKDDRCVLVFAGDCHDVALKCELYSLIARAKMNQTLSAKVKITGWIEPEDYDRYLQAVDCAIQLRSLSRGETSGAVLDCMAAGVPVIVNAHGSFSDIPEECALKLPDQVQLVDIVSALERLYNDAALRESLSQAALELIKTEHNPARCAELYARSIHEVINQNQENCLLLRQAALIAASSNVSRQDLANGLAILIHPEPRQRQLFLDVSAVAHEDLGSGVQRVVRCLCLEFLRRPPEGFRVEPVKVRSDGLGYVYAKQYALKLLCLGDIVDEHQLGPKDEPIHFAPGDVFLGIDLHHNAVIRQAPFYQYLRAQGVDVRFVVHDLLPCILPECFPPGASNKHEQWLGVVTQSDGLLCVSRTVADDLRQWVNQKCLPSVSARLAIDYFYHGSDFIKENEAADQSAPSVPQQPPCLAGISKAFPVLLMVGTIEPRKGYLDVVKASTLLWEKGDQFSLVIVGREGWIDLPAHQRRTIPETINAIRSHPLLGKSLFWLQDATDHELNLAYQYADGFIGASYGEGFGIPLIEAASHGLPLLVRDIPVFRELTAGRASYFPQKVDVDSLASSISMFLTQIRSRPPRECGTDSALVQSWSDSADQILKVLNLVQGAVTLVDPPMSLSVQPTLVSSIGEHVLPSSQARVRRIKHYVKTVSSRSKSYVRSLGIVAGLRVILSCFRRVKPVANSGSGKTGNLTFHARAYDKLINQLMAHGNPDS